MRRVLIGVLLAVAAVPAAMAQTVKVGVISTYSGPTGVFGEQMERGFRLYIKRNADKLPPG